MPIHELCGRCGGRPPGQWYTRPVILPAAGHPSAVFLSLLAKERFDDNQGHPDYPGGSGSNRSAPVLHREAGAREAADLPMGPGRRWLTVGAKDQKDLEIVLQPPEWFEGQEREQRAAMVRRNPPTAFSADDCRQTYTTLKWCAVEFTSPPQDQPYGVQAVAKDLCGNDFVLVEQRG